ncbi:MAG: type II toxin-antitoxin system RelE/ParE family toxin [Candidatus Caenarcaniphilales bacterium]|nr:type II toxin-antitoxin system RelE/ParE family toxin [Candidatus Caenarcaniphilales bacterium]
MSKYKIFETEVFVEDLKANLGSDYKRIVKKLSEQVYPILRESPFYGSNIKKLRGLKPDRWRYRIADYRFFYIVEDDLVIMIAAQHRKDSY